MAVTPGLAHGTVVMTTYNAGRSITAVLGEIEEAAEVLARSGITLDILIIDDDSPDGTAAIARKQATRLGLALDVVPAPASAGHRKSSALIAGLRQVSERPDTTFVVSLDASGHHDARQVTDLVRAFIARRSGLTIGSRWVRGGSSPGVHPLRATASRAATMAVRTVTGLRRVRDATTSFWVIRPDVIRTVLADELAVEGFGFYSTFVTLTQAYGYSIDEVPISFRPRYSGVDSLALTDVGHFAARLPTVRRRTRDVRASMRADQPTWAGRSGKLLHQDAVVGSNFGADVELERLADAEHFFGWVADEIAPHLGRRVLEVGAGIGTVSLALHERLPMAEITALEPDLRLHIDLTARTKAHPRIRAVNGTSGDIWASDPRPSYDSVVYVNVLEHILDDLHELQVARDLVTPGGTLAVFVPALPGLYGSLDYKSGHHRRYRLAELSSAVESAGFSVTLIKHLDTLGVLPYFLMYRLLDVGALGSVSSIGYDRVVVPLSRAVQRLVPNPPFGKNLLVIARRPR